MIRSPYRIATVFIFFLPNIENATTPAEAVSIVLAGTKREYVI